MSGTKEGVFLIYTQKETENFEHQSNCNTRRFCTDFSTLQWFAQHWIIWNTLQMSHYEYTEAICTCLPRNCHHKCDPYRLHRHEYVNTNSPLADQYNTLEQSMYRGQLCGRHLFVICARFASSQFACRCLCLTLLFCLTWLWGFFSLTRLHLGSLFAISTLIFVICVCKEIKKVALEVTI